ncbi:hypothetical protein CJJ07_002010 [Candidozyma auris]|nr:hypothetical protein CJJ07_002010 [[Candida] auris]QEL58117.1 hypothetical protein CJJ09_000149 [[Candida] auris]
MSDKIQVSARVRRRTESEIAAQSPIVVSVPDDFCSTDEPYVSVNASPNTSFGSGSDGSGKVFTLDQVYGANADQELIYKNIARPLLRDFMAGMNVTILAYGSTGSGKTYTMLGDVVGEHAGIVPRVLQELFQVAKDDICVKLSCVELYKEELHDLVNDELELNSKKPKLRLLGDGSRDGRGTMIQNLYELDVVDAKSGFEMLQKCLGKRKMGTTKLNSRSSRSHTIFTITLHKTVMSSSGQEVVRSSKMNLVDLAGSEDIIKSGATDASAKEAGSINQSLLTLGKVISALSEGKEPRHIPYRESKLTRLLQGSIGGRTKTALIATISPAKSNLMETMSTLTYASKAKNIKNIPQSTADSELVLKRTKIRELSAEISRLNRDLLATKGKDNSIRISLQNYEDFERKIAELRTELKEKDTQITGLHAKLQGRDKDIAELKLQIEQTLSENSKSRSDLAAKDAELHKTTKEFMHLKDKYSSQKERVSNVTGTGISSISRDVNEVINNLNDLTQVSSNVKEIPTVVQTHLCLFKKTLEGKLNDVSSKIEKETSAFEQVLANSMDFSTLHNVCQNLDFSSHVAGVNKRNEQLTDYINSTHLSEDSAMYKAFEKKFKARMAETYEALKEQYMQQMHLAFDGFVKSSKDANAEAVRESATEFMQEEKTTLSKEYRAYIHQNSQTLQSISTKTKSVATDLKSFKEVATKDVQGAFGRLQKETKQVIDNALADITNTSRSQADSIEKAATQKAHIVSDMIDKNYHGISRDLNHTEKNLKIFSQSLSELQRSPAQLKRPATSPTSRSPSRSPMRSPSRSPMRQLNGQSMIPDIKRRRTEMSPLRNDLHKSRIPQL